MGLAASQARLLTITSRKADCEFQSMNLSHQKIALSRDMENISTEYQQALNQTKLVYDYYGSGTSQMDLTYDMLMKPSVYNDYYPKLITDSQNRVVLDPRYAAAAQFAGIPAEGLNGTASSEIRDAFVEALAGYGQDNSGRPVPIRTKDGMPVNVISDKTLDIIESTTYNNSIGLGKSFSVTESTRNLSYKDLLDQIEAYCQTSESYGLEEFGGKVTGDTWGELVLLLSGEHRYPKDDKPTSTKQTEIVNNINNVSCSDTYIYVNGQETGGAQDISLVDLLKGDKDYTYAIESGKGAAYPLTDAAFLQDIIVGDKYSPSFLNWMVDQFSAIFGGVSTNDEALQYAYDAVANIVWPNNDVQDAADRFNLDSGEYYFSDKSKENKNGISKKSSNGYSAILDIATRLPKNSTWGRDELAGKAKDYIGCVVSDNHREGSTNTIAISLTNLAQVFMTAFVEYQQGVENSSYAYELGKIKEASLYKAKDNDVFVVSGNTSISGGEENLVAGFYDALFNQICVNGWITNDKISNTEYMQELLKNGCVFISSINNDGYYYQGSYSTDVYIAEIADTEAIAKAEAKYNSEKAKIENKENTIDMKLKNLDTEISSLTTEYDTTKSVINKNIEKSFKRYDA